MINRHLLVLSKIDLEILAAAAREHSIDSITLTENEYADFCKAINHKESRFKTWPKYRGITIKKSREKKK